jgi:hypothetical protein
MKVALHYELRKSWSAHASKPVSLRPILGGLQPTRKLTHGLEVDRGVGSVFAVIREESAVPAPSFSTMR